MLVLTGSDAWLFWLILLFLFGRIYAAPLDMITPMDSRRKIDRRHRAGRLRADLRAGPVLDGRPTPRRLLPGSTIWLPATMLTLYTLWRRR